MAQLREASGLLPMDKRELMLLNTHTGATFSSEPGAHVNLATLLMACEMFLTFL